MSLLGGLFKVVKKVVGTGLRAVASTATGGISDQVLSALKARGEAKKVAQANQYSLQQLALAEKLRPLSPKVRRTEQVLDDASSRTPSPANNPLYNDPYGRKRMPNGYRKAAAVLGGGAIGVLKPKRKRKRKAPAAPETAEREGLLMDIARLRPKQNRRTVAANLAADRKLPTGMLDLKRIGMMWTAQGKPGTWQEFVKANKNVRVS